MKRLSCNRVYYKYDLSTVINVLCVKLQNLIYFLLNLNLLQQTDGRQTVANTTITNITVTIITTIILFIRNILNHSMYGMLLCFVLLSKYV